MKQILTFLIVVGLGCSTGYSQITIDEGDMPVGGYAAKISIADSLFQPDLQTVGANVNWDFSNLEAVSQRTDSFVNVNSVPLLVRILFSTANVARIQNTPDSLGSVSLSDAFQFYRRRSSQYENLGIGGTISGLPIGLRNNPEDIVYRFPLTFGNQDSSEALAQLDIPNLFYIERSIKRWNEVDAWGQITTPYGTFDALRVKTSILESDSIATDTIQFRINIPLRREFKWLSKEERLPILTVNSLVVGNNNVSAVVSYIDSVRDVGTTTAVAQPLETVANMYPNPAKDQVQIELREKLGDDARMEIYAMDGKKLFIAPIYWGKNAISIPNLPTGIYQVIIRTNNKDYHGKLLLK